MRKGLWALAVVSLLALGLTALVTLSFDGAHDGKVAGNEALVLSAAWGLLGLLTAVAALRSDLPELRSLARILVTASLLYLVMGAFLGNARWADPWARYLGYFGAVVSGWLAESVLAPGEPEGGVGGLLALTATVIGFGACAFEVIRILEPFATLPKGQFLTPELDALHRSTRVFLTTTVWAAYALGTMIAGVILKSGSTRRLAAGMLGVSILYVAAAGLTNPAAAFSLRLGALLSLLISAGGAWAVGRATPGAGGQVKYPRV